EARQRVQLTNTNRSRAYPIRFTYALFRSSFQGANPELHVLSKDGYFLAAISEQLRFEKSKLP
ncbi:hypothetical protein, partial [Paenibacillus tyrfis]|uniref:hypothetical protein n=1 Tax=Paenibacillus tyrfis TaxID=1501230 RepID=UPI001C6FCE8D